MQGLLHKVYLLLGSNRGDRFCMLANARHYIGSQTGTICGLSSVFETSPWGFTDEINFLNQVCIIETGLSPLNLLDEILKIEKNIGRIRTNKQYSGRTIDIDILFYDDIIIQNKRLTIPHPRMQLRRFTLVPLVEIAPGLIHPVLNKTVLEILSLCNDLSEVKLYNPERVTENSSQ